MGTLQKRVNGYDRLFGRSDICWQWRGRPYLQPPDELYVTLSAENAKPIAQRVRKGAHQFKEKLDDLIKGLLSAKIIQLQTCPGLAQSFLLLQKNGVDIRLCIDYRLVNDLTQLMVYPMPLIRELLKNLDGAFWYRSLDMASGFWVVSMNERARRLLAFITPLRLLNVCGCHLGSWMRLKYISDSWITLYMGFYELFQEQRHVGQKICLRWDNQVHSRVPRLWDDSGHSDPRRIMEYVVHKGEAAVTCVWLLEFVDKRSQEFVRIPEGQLSWASSV